MNERDEVPDELRRALSQVDAEAQAAANRLDVARVSARVMSRLKTEPHARLAPHALRIAAAIALLAVGGSALLMTRGGEMGTALPVAIDSMSAADSQAVLLAVDGLARADTSTSAVNGVTMDDLSEQELRALLQALETEESL